MFYLRDGKTAHKSKMHINQHIALCSMQSQFNLVHFESIFLIAALSSCLFFSINASNTSPIPHYMLFCPSATSHATAPFDLPYYLFLSTLLSIAILLKSSDPPSPQTRRTFKVYSDNVTAAVHLFPIPCN